MASRSGRHVLLEIDGISLNSVPISFSSTFDVNIYQIAVDHFIKNIFFFLSSVKFLRRKKKQQHAQFDLSIYKIAHLNIPIFDKL